MFDFSDYPDDSKFFDPMNKNVIGKMKEVFEGKAISGFVGLKSKIHSMKSINGEEFNAMKGVNIATAFHEFEDTLFNKKIIRHKMKRFQSEKHKIGSYEIKTTTLSCFDGKRFVLGDEIQKLLILLKS